MGEFAAMMPGISRAWLAHWVHLLLALLELVGAAGSRAGEWNHGFTSPSGGSCTCSWRNRFCQRGSHGKVSSTRLKNVIYDSLSKRWTGRSIHRWKLKPSDVGSTGISPDQISAVQSLETDPSLSYVSLDCRNPASDPPVAPLQFQNPDLWAASFHLPGPAFGNLGPLGPETKQMLCHKLTTTTVTDVTVGYLQDSQARPVSPFLQNICGRWSQHFGCLSARWERLTMAAPTGRWGNGWQQDIHGDAMGCQSWGFDWPFNDQNDQNQGISWPEPADIPMYHPVVSGDTMLTCRFLQ